MEKLTFFVKQGRRKAKGCSGISKYLKRICEHKNTVELTDKKYIIISCKRCFKHISKLSRAGRNKIK